MEKKIKRFYEFGQFRIDLENRLLLRDGEIITLTPKSLDLLLFMVENCGRLLDKEELLSKVWPDACVEESNLTKNIFLLRKSLGERPDGKPYIETFPRRGYRFGADVRTSDNDVGDLSPGGVSHLEPAVGRTSARSWYFWVCCAASIFLVAAAGALWRRTGAPEVRSLAVLPFRTVGATADAYLAEGLAEELTTRLASIKSLRVISSQVADRFRDTQDPRDIGHRLAVDGVLTGTIRKDGEHLFATVQLIASHDGAILWADSSFDQPLRDLPGVEHRLAEAVVSGLRLRLAPPEISTVGRQSTRSADAYEALLRGKAHYNAAVRASDRSERDLALGFFTRASQLDPAYADAQAWLAMSSLLLFSSDAELQSASAYAEKALSIDPDHIQALRAMVEICHFLGRDQEGLRHAKRVLAIAPHGPGALAAAGRAYFRAGMSERAISLLEEAVRTDPDDDFSRYELGFAYYFSRQNLRGVDVLAPIADVPRVRWILPFHYADLGNCAKATDLAKSYPKPPDVQRFFLTKVFQICGDLDSARNELTAGALQLENLLARSDSSDGRTLLAMEYAELGRRADALEQVRRAQALTPGNSRVLWYTAETHAILGNRREALSYLRQSIDRGWVALYFFDQHQRPHFPLHLLIDDPEFRALRDEVARRVEALKKIY